MSFILKFSKYISVPILTEWLSRIDLLIFDASIVNNAEHDSFISLVKEYPSVFHDKMLLQSTFGQAVGLLELCGWYRRFGLPVEILCRVRICMFEVNLLTDYGWISSCMEMFNRLVNVEVEMGKYDLDPPNYLLSCVTAVKSLTVSAPHVNILNCFEQSTQLISLTISASLHSYADHVSLASICRQNPLLEIIEMHDFLNSAVTHSITVHCKRLKKLKCLMTTRSSSRNAFIFSFHSVSNSLIDIDWDISNDKDCLVWRTRWWYKGAKLTHLNLHYDQLIKYTKVRVVVDIITNTCPSLCALKLRCVTNIDNNFEDFVQAVGHCLNFIRFRQSLSDKVVAACLRCPTLQTLHIASSITLTTGELLTIVKSCPLLVNLHLKGLSEGYLPLVAPYLSNVRELSLPVSSYINFTMTDCVALIQYLKTLQSLEVELDVFEVDLFCGLLKIPSLTSLKLTTSEITLCDFGDSLSNVHCTNLTSLNLTMDINDANFITLLSRCPHLTTLHMSYSGCLTMRGIQELSTCCKKLCKVNISDFYIIGEKKLNKGVDEHA